MKNDKPDYKLLRQLRPEYVNYTRSDLILKVFRLTKQLRNRDATIQQHDTQIKFLTSFRERAKSKTWSNSVTF